MLTVQTSIRLDGISGAEIFEFLANPTDAAYQEWWPGVHLQFHRLGHHHADHVNDVVYMDEYIGARRLRMKGTVVDAVPGKRLVWELKRVIRLPARLELTLTDFEGGVAITHTTRAGFRGAGRILDPLIRLYLSKRFTRALDEHVKTEFPLLRDLLHGRAPRAARSRKPREPGAAP